MRARPEHLVIASLEPVVSGKSYRAGEELPLHMTIVPWWAADDDTGLVTRTFTSAVSHIDAPLVITGQDVDRFGSNSDILVRRVECTSEILGVHTLLLEKLVRECRGEVKSDYIEGRQGYNPHVSYLPDGLGLRKHETKSVRELQLVTRGADDRTKFVTSIAKLGQTGK